MDHYTCFKGKFEFRIIPVIQPFLNEEILCMVNDLNLDTVYKGYYDDIYYLLDSVNITYEVIVVTL